MKTSQFFKYTFFVLLILLAVYMFILSARVLLVLLIAIIVASAVRPLIMGLKKRGLPVGLSILMVYFVIAIVVALLSIAVIPPIVNQVTQYLENDARLAFHIIRAQHMTENLVSDVTNSDVSLVDPEQIRMAVSDFVDEIRRTIPSVLDDISATLGEAILIFVMGAYWLSSHNRATEFITELTPPGERDRTRKILTRMEDTLGSYVRGVLTIALIVGGLNFSLMMLGGIPNATTLAFIIAISSTIPMIGGLIGSVLVILVTLTSAPEYTPGVLVISLAIQQFEAYYLGPRIMADRVGLDPLLVIVYTAVGFVVFGIVGALVAVPVMSAVHILLVDLVIRPYQEHIRRIDLNGDGIPLLRHDAPDRHPQPGTD